MFLQRVLLNGLLLLFIQLELELQTQIHALYSCNNKNIFIKKLTSPKLIYLIQ